MKGVRPTTNEEAAEATRLLARLEATGGADATNIRAQLALAAVRLLINWDKPPADLPPSISAEEIDLAGALICRIARDALARMGV